MSEFWYNLTMLDPMAWFGLYIAICVGIALFVIGAFAYEDIKGKYDPKFGPNWKSGLSWFILLFYACPGLNLVTLALYIYTTLRYPVHGLSV